MTRNSNHASKTKGFLDMPTPSPHSSPFLKEGLFEMFRPILFICTRAHAQMKIDYLKLLTVDVIQYVFCNLHFFFF